MMCSSFPIYLCLWFLLVTTSQILLPYWKLEISKLSLLHPLWSWKCKGLLHLLSPIVMSQSLCFLQWTKKLQIQVYDTGAKEYQLEHKKQPFSVWKRMHLSAVLMEVSRSLPSTTRYPWMNLISTKMKKELPMPVPLIPSSSCLASLEYLSKHWPTC